MSEKIIECVLPNGQFARIREATMLDLLSTSTPIGLAARLITLDGESVSEENLGSMDLHCSMIILNHINDTMKKFDIKSRGVS